MDENIAYGKLRMIEKCLLLVYILSFSMDYKGEVGGSLSQFIMAGLALAAGFGFLIIGNKKQRYYEIAIGLKKITRLWWIYLLSTAFTGIIAGVILERYIRVFFPLLMFGISLLVICKCQKRKINPLIIINSLLYASIVSIIWKYCYAVLVSGIDLHIIRYQLLSVGGVVYILSYAIGNIVCGKKISFFPLLGLNLAFISIFLSITRSFAITMFFIVAGYCWLLLQKALALNMKKNIVFILIIVIISALCYYITKELREDILYLWTHRMLTYKLAGDSISSDLTLRTRLAEWSWQILSLFENPASLFFGKGLGSEYGMDTRYLNGYEALIGTINISMKTGWYSGHSMWIYSIYSGGLLFGWIIIKLSIGSLYRIMIYIHKKHVKSFQLFKSESIIVYFSILGFISQGFTSNPLADRFFSIIIGLLIGSVYWFYDFRENVVNLRDRVVA